MESYKKVQTENFFVQYPMDPSNEESISFRVRLVLRGGVDKSRQLKTVCFDSHQVGEWRQIAAEALRIRELRHEKNISECGRVAEAKVCSVWQ